MKHKAEIWQKCYCIDCSISTGQIIEILFRRLTRKCALCGRSIQELQNLEQSEEKKRLFWQLWEKEKQWPERRLRVQDRDYKWPLQDYFKGYAEREKYVFWTMLKEILENEAEFERFRQFVKKRREQ